MGTVPAGTWVEVGWTVLAPHERAPGLPADTAAVPLDVRVSGFLVEPASPGGPARIRTRAGRELAGTLLAVNPSYTHSFGQTVPELLTIGSEVPR